MRSRFRAWVASVGSQQKAAAVLGCSQMAVSSLCLSNENARTPGLRIALAIERATDGKIRASEWLDSEAA